MGGIQNMFANIHPKGTPASAISTPVVAHSLAPNREPLKKVADAMSAINATDIGNQVTVVSLVLSATLCVKG